MLAAALTAVALAVAPPPQPGPWKQLGAVVASKPGKQMHFFRLAPNAKALGVVATSTSAQPIRLHWWSYCEFVSDDEMTQANEATVTGLHSVVVYPPVLNGSTLCYVSVVARAAGGKVVGAVFSY